MANRIKKTVVECPSKDQLPQIAKAIATSQSQLKGIEAEMEQKIQKIRAGYQSKIETIREEIITRTNELEVYALENRSEFEKKKSQDIVHGIMGFRISTPSVKLGRGLTSKICGMLEAAGMTDFIRTKKELDKEKVLATRNDAEIMKKLNLLQITIEQPETFYFEPKEEAVMA